MKQSRLLGVVCACLTSLLFTTANAALTTAHTANCGVVYDDCDDAAFLTAVAAEGGNVPLDATLDFTQDKLGNALSGFVERPGDIFSDAVTFSSKPGTFGGAASTDVNSFVGDDGSGNSIHLVGPGNNLWDGILSIDFSSPVSTVGLSTAGISVTDTIYIYDTSDTLIGSFPGVSNAEFDYFGIVATAGEQISRIELDGDNISIQDIQFNYVAAPILPGDINFDGQVNIADYLLLTQFVLGTGSTPTAAELSAGDMNQNSQLEAGDLVIHSRTALGLI